MLLYLIACLFHQGEKFREVGGPLDKGCINGGPQSVLIGQRPWTIRFPDTGGQRAVAEQRTSPRSCGTFGYSQGVMEL